jgi:peptidase E
MKLFLASSLDKTMLRLFERTEKPANKTKVLFVENASDPIKEKPWVDADREAFRNFKCELNELDLREITKEELVKQIESADILHICGGSVLYILALIKKRGMFDIVLEAVKQGKII